MFPHEWMPVRHFGGRNPTEVMLALPHASCQEVPGFEEPHSWGGNFHRLVQVGSAGYSTVKLLFSPL